MAGNPVLRGMVADLCILARAEGLEEELAEVMPEYTEDDLGMAYVVGWFNGLAPEDESATLSGLARRLGISRRLLWMWMKQGDGARHTAYVRARAEGATFLVEDAMHRLNTADPREASLASSQANYLKWLAGVLSPKEFAQQKAPPAAISIGSLHLHAHANRKQRLIAASAQQADRTDTVTITNPQVEE